MNTLFTDILENIKQAYKQKSDKSADIAILIRDVIGIELPQKAIKVTGETLYLQISPTMKLAIAQNKPALLEKLAPLGITAIR